MVDNLAPWVPQNSVSRSGSFSIEKVRVDCVATDSAVVTARVRCWTQGPDAFAVDSGVVSGEDRDGQDIDELTTQQSTMLVCLSNTRRCLPDAGSQIRTVSSCPADTTKSPSGLTAMSGSASVWPASA